MRRGSPGGVGAVVVVAALAALALTGCGSGTAPAGDTVTLDGHSAERAVVQARLEARQHQLERALARRRAADRARRRERDRAPSAHSAHAPRATPGAGTAPPPPPIVQRPIPFGPTRKREMAAYARRHYGFSDFRLSDPKVIVEHYTASADAASAISTFSADVPDPELHELPGTCAHFVIDRDGTIYQLVPVRIMCRHTVGLNWTAIGIEHAGFSDGDVLGNPRELAASLALTRWLRCRLGIAVDNVIGHNESLSSPYHREAVAALRTQTHGDWTKADMEVYRARLGALGCGS